MTADYESKLKRKQLNAIKHGVFSSMAILPGEDGTEYAALLEAFRDEWSPEGPTETDAIFTLTNCVWRKRRIKQFINAKVLYRALDPKHPSFDRDFVFELIQLDPKHSESFIENISPLREHFAKTIHKDLRDLAETADLAKKFRDFMSEELKSPSPPLPDDAKLMRSADILGEDLFKQELAMEERLDAMIDRAIKRLMQAKAMKQMLASPSLNGQAQQPKRISKQTETQSSTQEHQEH